MEQPFELYLSLESPGPVRLVVSICPEKLTVADPNRANAEENSPPTSQAFDGEEPRAIVARFFSPC